MARPKIATHSGYTAKPATRSPHRDGVANRDRGGKRQRRNARLFARHRLCCICAARGLHTPADEVDHIHALEDGGAEQERNCWPLCHGCHVAKTNDENARRARGEDTSAPLAWLPPRPAELDQEATLA